MNSHDHDQCCQTCSDSGEVSSFGRHGSTLLEGTPWTISFSLATSLLPLGSLTLKKNDAQIVPSGE